MTEIQPESELDIIEKRLVRQYAEWKRLSGELAWGVAKVFKDILSAASDGKTRLVYGADITARGGFIINDIGVHLGVADSEGNPYILFTDVIKQFDQINSNLYMTGLNYKPGIVDAKAAKILLIHFANIDTPPVEVQVSSATEQEAFESLQAREPHDEEVARNLAALFVISQAPTVLRFDYTNIDRYQMVPLPQREANFQE